MPINYSNEIDKSSLHSYVSDISTPYLIGMINLQIMQEVWIFFVCLVRYGGVLVRIDSSYSESLHETPDFEMSCVESFLSEYNTHSS